MKARPRVVSVLKVNLQMDLHTHTTGNTSCLTFLQKRFTHT